MKKRSSERIAESATFGDTRPVEWTIAPARRTVAAHARNAEDARQLLEMLGLIEARPAAQAVDDAPVKCQRNCGGCGKPMRNQGEDPAMWPGTVAVRARGRCGPCYEAIPRDRYAS